MLPLQQVRHFGFRVAPGDKDLAGLEQRRIALRETDHDEFQRQAPRHRIARAGEQHVVALVLADRANQRHADIPGAGHRGGARHGGQGGRVRARLDVDLREVPLKPRGRIRGGGHDVARLRKPRGASRTKRGHRYFFPQRGAILADAGLANGYGGFLAIAPGAIDQRHARTDPGIVVQHDIVGHAERAQRIDDARIEVQEMRDLHLLDPQAPQQADQLRQVCWDVVAQIRRL